MYRWLLAFVLVASHAAAGQNPPAPRFRAGAEVIAIDVTVIDRTGAQVGDLTAADFTVTVEGRPRAIQSAQFLRSETSQARQSLDASSNTAAASGRLLLIVTDEGSLRPSSHAVVETAARVLDHLGPGDLVGVSHIPEGGGVAFTTDRARVIAELKRLRPSAVRFRSDTTIYISEALDYDGSKTLQWPAAVARECGTAADSPVYRLCVFNLEHAARQMLIEESVRTTATIRGLEQLMKSLAPTGQPVTLVLISESLVIARDPAALVGLAEACAEARVSLHVVQPAPPTAEMTERGFPSDPVLDTALRVQGLELMAAQARGAFHRVVSTGASTFDAIGREVSGYYLLGIEPDAEDRRSRRRRVDVKVGRPGLTVRARSMFALDRAAPESAADPAARLRQMLEAPVPVRGLPIRITARTLSGDQDRARVLVAAEVGDPTDQKTRFHVGLIAIDGEGAVKTRTAATTVLEPARAGRQSPSHFTTSLLLEPGDYSLRLAVVDETGRSGSVHHTIHAALREWPGGLRSSDLIVANEPRAGEFPPFNPSSIVDTSRVAAVMELSHDDAAVLGQVTVRFEVDGDVVEAEAAPGAGQSTRSFASLMTLSKPGEHQLKAVVTAPGRDAIILDRTFSYDPEPADPLDPRLTRAFIEALERRLPPSPALASYVAEAKRGQFVAAPEADTRPDGDLAMVTFVGGLAALGDGKTALARALFQQTLRKAPGFEGAQFYLALLK